ncbi:MAG: IPT/TIG domain-containing protein [Bacteroidota bacterium]
MNRKYRIILILIVAVIFFMCEDKKEVTPRDYPRVSTLDVTDITDSGALFSGEIIYPGKGPITEHGFLWRKYSDPEYDNSEKKVIAEQISDGKFSASISSNLISRTKYKVRAYAKNDDYFVYGKTVEFVSLGSAGPKISSFEPSTGTWGDTVKILGNNFSYLVNNNYVTIGSTHSKVVSASDTLIYAIVPDKLKTSGKVKVIVAGNASESLEDFELAQTEISSIYPTTGKTYDTLVLVGKNFGRNADYLEVYFNDKKSKTITADRDSITVEVPSGLNNPVNIQVKRSGIDLTSIEGFNYFSPEVISFSPHNGTIYDTITITGKNFQGRNNLDSIFVNGLYTDHFSESDSLLTTLVPQHINIDKFNISILSSGFNLSFSNQFTMNEMVVSEITPNKVSFSDNITITGSGFHPDFNRNTVLINNYPANIISGNSTELIFTIPSNLPINTTGNLKVSINNGFNYSIMLIDSLKFNLPEILNVYPQEVFDVNQVITIKGNDFVSTDKLKLYMGGIACIIKSNSSSEIQFRLAPEYYTNGTFNVLKNDAISYSINNGAEIIIPQNIKTLIRYHAWSKLESFPETGRIFPYHFTINDKIYLGGGEDSNQTYRDLWEFDLKTFIWTKKANLPGRSRSKSSNISINEKGYVGLGLHKDYDANNDFWEYNPINDSWFQLANYPPGSRYGSMSFSNNDNFHIAGGFTSGNSNIVPKSEHYIYNTVSGTWQQDSALFDDAYLNDIYIPSTSTPFVSAINIDTIKYLLMKPAWIRINNGGQGTNMKLMYRKYENGQKWVKIYEEEFAINASFNYPCYINNTLFYVISGPYGGGIYKFDENLVKFELLESISLPYYNYSVIASNNRIYFMLGYSYFEYFTDVWELDPSKL